MQFVCSDIKNRFCLGLDNLREDALKYMDMLISEIQNKETTIEGLKEEITGLNRRLQDVDIRYQETLEELEQTKSEFKKVMDVIENMKKTILHIAPIKEVQEQRIDEECDGEGQEWDEPSIRDIFLIIKHSLNSNYFEIADRALLILSDSYIREERVKDEEWQEVTELLNEFVIRLQESEECLTEGLIHLVKTAYETGCRPILDNLINKTGEILEDIVLKKAPSFKSMEDAFVLLNNYFIDSNDSGTIRLLNKILDLNIYPDNMKIGRKQCMELLFISLCFSMDDIIIEKPYVQIELDDNIPEVKCYNYYYDTINGIISIEQGVKEIENLKENLKIISPGVKDKAIEFIIKSLYCKANQEDANNIEQNIEILENSRCKKDMDGNLLFYPRERSGQNEAVMAISFIKKGRRECSLCGSALSLRTGDLAYYSGKNKIAGYTECELLYCEKCGGYFADQPMVDNIIPGIRPYKIRLARQRPQENNEQDMAAF